MTTLQPIGPRLLVRPDEPIRQIGTIALPDKAQRNVTRGTIVAVGDLIEERVQKVVEVYDSDVLQYTDGSAVLRPVVGSIVRLNSGGPEMTVTKIAMPENEFYHVEVTYFDRYRIPIDIGTRVVYADYTGVEIKEQGEKLLMLTLKDVFAIETSQETNG